MTPSSSSLGDLDKADSGSNLADDLFLDLQAKEESHVEVPEVPLNPSEFGEGPTIRMPDNLSPSVPVPVVNPTSATSANAAPDRNVSLTDIEEGPVSDGASWGQEWTAPPDQGIPDEKQGTPSRDTALPELDLRGTVPSEPRMPEEEPSRDIDLLGGEPPPRPPARLPSVAPPLGLPVGASGSSDASPRATSGLTLLPRKVAPSSVEMPALDKPSFLSEAPVSAPSPMPPAASPSAPEEEVSVSSPCGLLLVGQNRGAGAQTAAGLMAFGYTCRVVTPSEAESLSNYDAFEVAVIDLPAQVAKGEGADRWLGTFASWNGQVVLTSNAPVATDILAQIRPVAAVLTRPFHNDELVKAIEASRKIEASGNSVPQGSLSESEADSDGFFELSANMVRVIVISAEGQASRGRARAMSYRGGMVVDLKQPLLTDSPLSAELTCVDGERHGYRGKVQRTTAEQILVQLEIAEERKPHFDRFLTEARDITQPSIYQIRIRAQDPSMRVETWLDDQALARLWNDASNALEDDATQQRFIQACLKANKVDFAVRCYRELKEDNPEDERVARYLNQVGTILGFYAFRKEATQVQENDGGLSSPVKWTLGLFVFAALALWLIAAVWGN